jgi:hypothetical protein
VPFFPNGKNVAERRRKVSAEIGKVLLVLRRLGLDPWMRPRGRGR